MRWCWQRRPRPREVDETARLAVEQSMRRLEEARSLTGRVERVVMKLETIKQRNGFAAMVRDAFGEHR
jgi:hypothetical protein